VTTTDYALRWHKTTIYYKRSDH